jgi:hypothetical protein
MANPRDLLALLASAENTAALEAIYDRVVDRILRELAAGVSRPGAGRARDLLIRLREIAAEIDPTKDSQVRRWIQRELPKAFILGDKTAVQEIRQQLEDAVAEPRAAFGEINRSFVALNTLQLRTLAATMTDRLSSVHRQVLETAGLVVRRTQLILQQDQEVREAIVSGIIRGTSQRQRSNDIARVILTGKAAPDVVARLRQAGFAGEIELYKQVGRGELITVGKRRMKVRAYSNLVSKTMSREAASVSTVVRLQQNGVNHVQVSSNRPERADVCTLILGQVYYIGPGEDPLGFPSLKEIPGGHFPPHPNCRHTLKAWVAALKREPEIQRARRLAGLVPDRFFGKTTSEVEDLVHALSDDELRKIAPAAYDDEIPPNKPKEAA